MKTSPETTYSQQKHLTFPQLTCLVERPDLCSVSAADSGRIWPSMLNRSLLHQCNVEFTTDGPFSGDQAGFRSSFIYIYRRPSLGWNFRWNCIYEIDHVMINLQMWKCWWIQLHKNRETVYNIIHSGSTFPTSYQAKKAPTLWQPIEWF